MIARLLLILSLVLAVGCEKTNHESIEKWRRTEKGPGKLKKTLRDAKLDADLSAHAAMVMIDTGADGDVRQALEEMDADRRVALLGKLIPRLWEMARIQREEALPNPPHIVAKDHLFLFRKYADEAQKAQIDGYLIDWYAVVSYEQRAKNGSAQGATVMRTLGPPAGKKLVSVLNGFITKPGQETTKVRINDELLIGIAASGSPEGVARLLELVRLDRGDPTLGNRVMEALRLAYVDPSNLFDMQEPAALVANLDALVALARDESSTPVVANRAIELIRRIGPPKCTEALSSLIGRPHPDMVFRYAVASSALICGGAKAVGPVISAMPDGNYEGAALVGAVVAEIAKMTPRDEVLATVRQALGGSKMARWLAIETLARMKSVEDAPRIAALAGAKDRLVGYWGDQSQVPAAERKADPTLGARAKELATQLGAK